MKIRRTHALFLVGLASVSGIVGGAALSATEQDGSDAAFVTAGDAADPWYAAGAGVPVAASDVSGLNEDNSAPLDPNTIRLMASSGPVDVYRASGARGSAYPDCAIITDPFGTTVACSPARDLKTTPRAFPSTYEGRRSITVVIGPGNAKSATADGQSYGLENGIMIADTPTAISQVELRDASGSEVSHVSLTEPR